MSSCGNEYGPGVGACGLKVEVCELRRDVAGMDGDEESCWGFVEA